MAKFNRQLPSDHEAARGARETAKAEADKKAQLEDAHLRQAVDWMLADERGRLVWAWMFRRCGWTRPALAYFAGGDAAPLRTEVLAGLRDLYSDLRRLAEPGALVAAEVAAEHGEEAAIAILKKDQKGE